LPSTDYSNSAGQIYTDVAKAYLTSVKTLDLQCSSSVADPISALQLPSWVPDFNDLVPGDELMLMAKSDFDADRGAVNNNQRCDAVLEVSADNKVLRVLGKRFDSISGVSLDGYHQRFSKVETARGNFLDACDLDMSLEAYPTGEMLTVALLKTLCFNRASNTDLLNIENRLGTWYNNLKNNGGFANLRYERAEKPSFWMTTSPLCVTKKGYIGITPLAAAPGDVIAVLGGVPLVLRRVDDSKTDLEAYRLVGPCYVHGIMNGEAFQEDRSQLESIHLV
jgi:hypothetical protein